MNQFEKYSVPLIVLSALLIGGCSPQVSNPKPTVDIVGTTAAQLASMILTQTAAANTPTPPPATSTPLPVFTDTPTLAPTPAVTSVPKVSGDTSCYTGPNNNSPLVSRVSDTEEVEVVGISSVPGWYVIRNPIYGSLCWISASNLNFESDFDLSTLPTIP